MQNNGSPDTTVWDVNDESKVNTVGKCPFSGGALNKSAGGGTRNRVTIEHPASTLFSV